MATWWEITFTGEPTEGDFEHVSEMLRQGCTSGQLINDEGTEDGPRCAACGASTDLVAADLPSSPHTHLCADGVACTDRQAVTS